MKKFIDIIYHTEPKEIQITYQEKRLSTSRIQDIPISEWGSPFVKNGVRWYGIYEELKYFCEDDDFSIIFHGSDADMQTLKNTLSDKNRPLAKLNRHIKITDTSKQGKTESKSLSSVAVSF